MADSSGAKPWWKKYFFPVLSIVVIMLVGGSIFIVPPPLVTEYHETKPDQYQHITIQPDITIELDTGSALMLTRSQSPKVELLRGNAYFDTGNKSADARQLEVIAGDVRILGKSAGFGVVIANQGGSVAVSTGQVEMILHGQGKSISAGQRVDFDSKQITVESSITDSDIAPWRQRK